MATIAVHFGPDGPTVFVTPNLDLDKLREIWRKVLCKTGYINYSPAIAATAYQDSNIKFIETDDGEIRSPYQLLFDYRSLPTEYACWGTVKFADEQYHLPNALQGRREALVREFKQKKLLKKGNQPALRVAGFGVINHTPNFALQKAYYYDQVGSNLTIDAPRFQEPITVNGVDCLSVREWDVAQANGERKELPTFEQSKLANTIGIAVAITARSQDGRWYWLRRKRSADVAVFQRMWHVPLSYALTFEEQSASFRDLNSLIRIDQAAERSEELAGLEVGDFGYLKPLAFCRDLARGGKPQFFFELSAKVSLEELIKKARDTTNEFVGQMEHFSQLELDTDVSPELVCSMLLLSSRP